MLIIREPQIEIFHRAALYRFPEELVRYIVHTYPEATRTLTHAELRKRVDLGIARAQDFGIRDLNAVAGFVALMFSLGPQFHRHPSFKTILSDDRVPPMLRLSRLFELSAWSWLATRDASEAAWQSALAQPVPEAEIGIGCR